MDGLGICVLILVATSFALFLMRVIFIFYHNITLARELKRISREISARQCNAEVGVEFTSQMGNQPPKDDLPPAYDDVVQNYANAKLALQTAEEGQGTSSLASPSANLTTAHSTVTMETFVDANAVSRSDLSNEAAVTTCTGTSATVSNVSTLDSSTSLPTHQACHSNGCAGGTPNDIK